MRLLRGTPSLCFAALAIMMPGGIFLRRTTAFVWSTTPQRNFARATGSSVANPRLSSLARPATVEKKEASDSIGKAAQDSLSIVGKSVTLASLQGVPYFNTKDCDEFRVLFVLGGPGAGRSICRRFCLVATKDPGSHKKIPSSTSFSGKGTQSDLMKEKYPCFHLSAGELLRAETKKEESPHRELIETCLVSGNIVPVEISLSLLENAMREAANEYGKELIFLVDGFPRNFDNLDGWIRCMKGVATVWGVLNYQCPLDELERRILSRAKDSGRSDDNLQSARKRFATFERETMPVVETLRQVEKLQEDANEPSVRVFDIRGDQSVENVWKDTQRAMDRMISYDVLSAQSQLMEAVQTKNAELYRKVCADEWFQEGGKSAEEVLNLQEGENGSWKISNLKLGYISGTKVALEYDRSMGDVKVTEKRIWSHQGTQGWKNIHFQRLPAAQ